MALLTVSQERCWHVLTPLSEAVRTDPVLTPPQSVLTPPQSVLTPHLARFDHSLIQFLPGNGPTELLDAQCRHFDRF